MKLNRPTGSENSTRRSMSLPGTASSRATEPKRAIDFTENLPSFSRLAASIRNTPSLFMDGSPATFPIDERGIPGSESHKSTEGDKKKPNRKGEPDAGYPVRAVTRSGRGGGGAGGGGGGAGGSPRSPSSPRGQGGGSGQPGG